MEMFARTSERSPEKKARSRRSRLGGRTRLSSRTGKKGLRGDGGGSPSRSPSRSGGDGGQSWRVTFPPRRPPPGRMQPLPVRTELRGDELAERRRLAAESGTGTGQCGRGPLWEPCVPQPQANARFARCCAQANLGRCNSICRYDAKSEETRAAVLRGDCKIGDISPVIACASERQPSTECCAAHGVDALTYPQCQAFCDHRQSLSRVGIEHLACLNSIRAIMKCHQSHLRNP